jgi:hypothetical protein
VKFVENYFNYFTEIEEQFQRRRGTVLLLSTLDWALIETWRDAGIPLEAVLRGIDAAFDRYESRPHRTARRINGLAWCAQAVMTAAEEMQEASVGAANPQMAAVRPGLEWQRIATHLTTAAGQLRAAPLTGLGAQNASETADRLTALCATPSESTPNLEELERTLTVLEERLLSTLLATVPEDELTAIRRESEQEIAPYRRRMQALQIRQIEQQFLHKRLFEKYALPRLSLFYMRQE